MTHQIFISYSSRDQAPAQAICRALEAAGIPCWIAPRDIAAASQWGGSIVGAIQASRAVLIVFSEQSNTSPQVAREMECAVAQRLPLIPVRIADAMPTEDMQYFLGVSHWLDAFAEPLPTYLPQIVEVTKRVLRGEVSPWKRFSRRLPQQRVRVLAGIGGALIVALVTAIIMRPSPPPDPRDAMRSPLAGRWQADMPDTQGRKKFCVLDVQEFGQAVFSDTCPVPLAGSQVGLQVNKDGTWAPQLYTAGKDTGTFTASGGMVQGMSGSFRLEGSNRLFTRTSHVGEISWQRIKADGALPSEMAGITPKEPEWPVKDVPGIAARALSYARDKWAADAMLMAIKAEFEGTTASYAANLMTPAGSAELSFELYSPSKQEQLNFMPNSRYMGMSVMGGAEKDERLALPQQFVDLPEAVAALQAHGMRGRQVKLAELQNWGTDAVYHGVPVSGPAWVIESTLGERGSVPALRSQGPARK